MEAREADTAKVTSAMGSESSRTLGSSARLGKRGWGNLERQGSMVRMSKDYRKDGEKRVEQDNRRCRVGEV